MSVNLIKVDTIEEIKKNKVIAVIRADSPDIALEFARGCVEGGIKVIEVTFSFPRVERVITELSKIEDIIVGAGTLLDTKLVEKAIDAGAVFLVSPHTDEDILELAKDHKLPCIQGALTSSEIVNAWKLGVDMVKIFPASTVGGPTYVKAIKDALPFAEIFTTGGVNYDNFLDYIKAGASAVGLSSAFLTEDKKIRFNTVVENSRKIVEKLSGNYKR
jgi:2-dehydro-3-deoxyphosphogluconate aldolase/(4S)-4-hydroxy-2-oxoglutarate aldolase